MAVISFSLGCADPPPPRVVRTLEPTSAPSFPVVRPAGLVGGRHTVQVGKGRWCRAVERREGAGSGAAWMPLPVGRGGADAVVVLAAVALVAVAVAVAEGPAKGDVVRCASEPMRGGTARITSGAHELVAAVDAAGFASVPFPLDPGWVVTVGDVEALPW